MTEEPVLRAKNIKKRFAKDQDFLLNGISLDVRAGESVAIIGKSGSGKTSLLHILGALDMKAEGEVSICRRSTLDRTAELRNRHVGFIFQSFHLLEDYSLLENVLMPAKIAGKNGVDALKIVRDLLDRAGLTEKADLPAKLLSGGEKQRAALVRAFCNDPAVIFADEPTGNLDSANAKRVQELLFESVRNRKKALVLVTHDEEFAGLCDRVFLLKEGLLHPYKGC